MPTKDEYKHRYHIVDEGDFVFLRKLYADQVIDWDPNEYLDALKREALWSRNTYEIFFRLIWSFHNQYFDLPNEWRLDEIHPLSNVKHPLLEWTFKHKETGVDQTYKHPRRRLLFLEWWLRKSQYQLFCESVKRNQVPSKINSNSTAKYPFSRPERLIERKISASDSRKLNSLQAEKIKDWLHPHEVSLANKKGIAEARLRVLNKVDLDKNFEVAEQGNKLRYENIWQRNFKIVSQIFLDKPEDERKQTTKQLYNIRTMVRFGWLGNLQFGNRFISEVELLAFWEDFCSWGTLDKRGDPVRKIKPRIHPLFEDIVEQQLAESKLRDASKAFNYKVQEAKRMTLFLSHGIFPAPTAKDKSLDHLLNGDTYSDLLTRSNQKKAALK